MSKTTMKAPKQKSKPKPAPKGRKPAKGKVHTRPGMKLVATMEEVQALAASDEVVAACPAPIVRTREIIVADAIASMSEGVSLRKIAAAEKMGLTTLYSWLTVPEYAEQYARAREAQAMWWVEKALAVAAGTEDGQVPDAQRDRLHVDTLKWAASKFHPKQFGDKVDLTSGGESFGALVAASMKIKQEAP